MGAGLWRDGLRRGMRRWQQGAERGGQGQAEAVRPRRAAGEHSAHAGHQLREQGPPHWLQVRAGDRSAGPGREAHVLLAVRRHGRRRLALVHAHERRSERQDGEPRLRRAAPRAEERPSGDGPRPVGEGQDLRRRTGVQGAGRRPGARRDGLRRDLEGRRAPSRHQRPERRRQQRDHRKGHDGRSAQGRRRAHDERRPRGDGQQAREGRQDHRRRQGERAGMGRRREHRPFRRRRNG